MGQFETQKGDSALIPALAGGASIEDAARIAGVRGRSDSGPGAFAFGMHVQGCALGAEACEACAVGAIEPCAACGRPERRIIELVEVSSREETAARRRAGRKRLWAG